MTEQKRGKNLGKGKNYCEKFGKKKSKFYTNIYGAMIRLSRSASGGSEIILFQFL